MTSMLISRRCETWEEQILSPSRGSPREWATWWFDSDESSPRDKLETQTIITVPSCTSQEPAVRLRQGYKLPIAVGQQRPSVQRRRLCGAPNLPWPRLRVGWLHTRPIARDN